MAGVEEEEGEEEEGEEEEGEEGVDLLIALAGELSLAPFSFLGVLEGEVFSVSFVSFVLLSPFLGVVLSASLLLSLEEVVVLELLLGSVLFLASFGFPVDFCMAYRVQLTPVVLLFSKNSGGTTLGPV